MIKDYWIHQSAKVKEPFAAHVYVIDGEWIDISWYAEYLPQKAIRQLAIPVTYNGLYDAVKGFLAEYGKQLGMLDIEDIQDCWIQIARDFYLDSKGRINHD